MRKFEISWHELEHAMNTKDFLWWCYCQFRDNFPTEKPENLILSWAGEQSDKKFQPRVHGNGFIQLDLTPTRRLHIWGHPEIPCQATPTPIHDHMFNFTSKVLLGTMVNDKKKFFPSPEGAWMVHTVNVRDREDTTLHPTGERGDIVSSTFEEVRAGHQYRMKVGEIHFSKPIGLCATIIEKEGKTLSQGGPSPRVFIPVDVTPDNTFHRYAVTKEKLWAIIADVLWRAVSI